MSAVAYCRGVTWDRFFEDLEGQLDVEWEAERAALDTEAERLRIARIPLRDRLVAIARAGRTVSVHVGDGGPLAGHVTRVGVDWCAIVPEDGAPRAVIVPLAAIVEIAASADVVLQAVRDAQPGPMLTQRMGLGFVLRDLARRRTPVTVHTRDRRMLTGTIDRAGADHLDIALHDRGAPRRRGDVTGYRVVPFAGVCAVELDRPVDLL